MLRYDQLVNCDGSKEETDRLLANDTLLARKYTFGSLLGETELHFLALWFLRPALPIGQFTTECHSVMHTDKLSANGATTANFEDLLATVQHQVGDWEKFLSTAIASSKVVPIRKLLGPNALYWGMPTRSVIHLATAARLLQLRPAGKSADASFDWIEAVDEWIATAQQPVDCHHAMTAIAWSHALGPLAKILPPEKWQQLVATLLVMCGRDTGGGAGRSEVATLLLRAELPMSLAYAMPWLKICRRQSEPARSHFSTLLDDWLDGEGIPQAPLVPEMQLLLASCIRTITLDGLVKKGRIDKSARLQFDWLTRQTLRLARTDGTTAFQVDADGPYFDDMLKAAFKLTKDDSDKAAFRMLRGKRKSTQDDVPSPTERSEWAKVATMRTSWLPNAARLALTFPRNSLNWELSVGREVVSSGSCVPRIVVNEQPVTIQSDWDVLCWESDNDMDYIELECQLSHGWRLQRQYLLAREDLFAYVADAVLGPEVANIQYQHTLPLEDGITLEQTDETSEAVIMSRKRLGKIIPLSLSEWVSAQRDSRLRLDPARLELQQTGRALYAPLFIDLNSTRRTKALTWRQLTVAEQLQIVPPDVAVAYRVQIGKKQWIVYRSLDKPGNRTFLGVNLISDFLLARFNSNGEAETLIDVSDE